MTEPTATQTLVWTKETPAVPGFYLMAFPTQSSLYNLGQLPQVAVCICLTNGKIRYHDEEGGAEVVKDPRMVWAWLGDGSFMDVDPTLPPLPPEPA